MTNEEIDTLIATHVMGWEHFTLTYAGTEDETPRQKELTPWLHDVGIEYVGEYWIDVPSRFWRPVQGRQPSTRISQAWQALEKFPPYRHSVLILGAAGKWSCRIGTHFAVADSAAMAICLACLHAVGVPIETYVE